MTGTMQTLTTQTDIPFQVYQVGPADAKGAVLILHEWWGLKPHNLTWAEKLAEQGYLALVADLYDGRVTDDVEVAGHWMREIDQEAADAKLKKALDHLSAPGRKIAVYGCSFGGKQAMQASLLDPEKVNATILGYCRMETDVAKLKTLNGPVLAIYAEQERGWPEKQDDFEDAMAQAGQYTQGVSYDAAHGFTNPESPRYDADADASAWADIEEFLRRELSEE